MIAAPEFFSPTRLAEYFCFVFGVVAFKPASTPDPNFYSFLLWKCVDQCCCYFVEVKQLKWKGQEEMPYLPIDIAINAKRFLRAYVNYNFKQVELSFPPSAEGSLDIFT